MDLALLDRVLAERGEPAYRARQVWEWTARGVGSYEEMTTLPKALRAALAESVPFSTLEVVTERRSRDGTVKTLFRTADGVAHQARVLVSGVGQLNRPAYPEIPGLDQFAGTTFHSARWNHAHDLAGEHVAVIGEQARRCSEIVDELMNFAKPDPPQRRRFKLGEAVALWVAHWIEQGQLSRSQVDLEISDEAYVEADPRQIQGVFDELLKNALSAAPPESRRLTINCGRGPSDDRVALTVADNGQGMPPEVLEKARDPFFSHRSAGRRGFRSRAAERSRPPPAPRPTPSRRSSRHLDRS